MDALPITEENDVPYKSKRNGVMHACGHDVHTTCLLGAIKIVLSQRQRLKRNVKFIFQPGEELLPGGASLMLKEGAIDPTKCKEIYALHVFPSLETGKIGLRRSYMASSDELYIEVQGKGGHGGMPFDDRSYFCGDHIVTGIQSIISRRCDPTIPCVLTIGKINSEGGATNIIPTKVHLEGTFRTMDEKWRAEAHSLIVTYCESVAAAHGAEARWLLKRIPYFSQ
jgi:amidohydrolase